MSVRKERVADEIRDVLGRAFTGDEMRDPRVSSVTITSVKISPDLQVATVYFRLMDQDASQEEAKEGLERAAGFLRSKLAKQVELRRVPNLRFFFDESIERGSRIEDLLNSIK